MAGSGVVVWSQTASDNASSDSAINWKEGQSPSSVNNSARAIASIAKWRDDISGALTTTGTATAYSIALNQAPDQLSVLEGQMVTFVPHVTNDATVTLNVSGFGAKPLRGLTGKDLLAGVLIEGTPYTASYYAATQEWILHGAYGDPYGIPLGGGLPYFGTTAPNTAFAFPSGQTLSRTAYASLFALFGTRFGTGDGSTTFNIPDLRGRGLSFLDNMGGTAAGRITTAGSSIDGTTLGATGGAEAVTLTTAQIPAHTHPNTLSDPGHAHLYGLGTGGTAGGAGSGVAVITVNTSTSANVTGITINNASQGGGGAHTNMSPTFMANCIIRIM